MFARELLPMLGPGAALAVLGSITTGASAAGTTQATATAISSVYTVCSTATEGQGFVLPAAMNAPDQGEFLNISAVDVLVYPTVGGKLNGAAANVPVQVGPLRSISFTYINGSDCLIGL